MTSVEISLELFSDLNFDNGPEQLLVVYRLTSLYFCLMSRQKWLFKKTLFHQGEKKEKTNKNELYAGNC